MAGTDASGNFINPNWSNADQVAATATLAAIVVKFDAAYEAYINPVTPISGPALKQAVLNVLAEWREFNQRLSTTLYEQDSSVIDTIGPLAEEVAEQKQVLQRLQRTAVTRNDQVSVLNPKASPSPYVNILGLQRTFRPNTRSALLWVAVAFGFLTLCVLSAMIFMFVTRGIVATPSMVGGDRSVSVRTVRFAPDT
jgi:hypothetical protein